MSSRGLDFDREISTNPFEMKKQMRASSKHKIVKRKHSKTTIDSRTFLDAMAKLESKKETFTPDFKRVS